MMTFWKIRPICNLRQSGGRDDPAADFCVLGIMILLRAKSGRNGQKAPGNEQKKEKLRIPCGEMRSGLTKT